MTHNPVGWFEIYVDDMNRAKTFYESVFATELEKLEDPNKSDSDGTGIEMLAFPSNEEKYGAPGALVKMDSVSAGGNSTLVYFSCEDCATEESRIESAGGQIQSPKTSIGQYGFITIAVDTEGNVFGLHSLH
ncbi:VOC family protein [Marinibactrum halimedae]|uniref:Glyoxalase n=1 Tax=Marinibactrum halimedae TaxID=1444977 RepID=A0AA37WNM9_9GAMM|nr:VOC family protein [Marinibactrum halimedae]MCD9457889.1 VOC family protein [Marinibactrum halimedae]GLS26286.1 glyoxalase [Marinibactrum halimedae]